MENNIALDWGLYMELALKPVLQSFVAETRHGRRADP
jgi:hypothetical protein